MVSRIVIALMLQIGAGACSEHEGSTHQAPPPSGSARITERQQECKSTGNTDLRIRTHCSLMGYRVSLLIAFPESLGDRTLYMIDCSKQRMDCKAVTMRLERAPSALDPSDVDIGSYRLTVRHPSRVVIEEIQPQAPVSKKTIAIDTERGTATIDIIGKSQRDDWKAEVECEEVQKSIPSIEANLRAQERDLGLSPHDPLVRPDVK